MLKIGDKLKSKLPIGGMKTGTVVTILSAYYDNYEKQYIYCFAGIDGLWTQKFINRAYQVLKTEPKGHPLTKIFK